MNDKDREQELWDWVAKCTFAQEDAWDTVDDIACSLDDPQRVGELIDILCKTAGQVRMHLELADKFVNLSEDAVAEITNRRSELVRILLGVGGEDEV